MDVIEDKIKVHCNGPYVLYMEVCVKSLSNGTLASGSLEVHVEGHKPLVRGRFPLEAKGNEEDCRGHRSTVYLKLNESVTLRFYSEENLKVVQVNLGLRYLLTQCILY